MMKRKKYSGRSCPCCGKPLLQEGHFCYSCCSFLDENDSRLLLPGQVSDQALTALLEKSRAANQAKDGTLRSRIAGKLGMLAMLCMGGVIVIVLFFEQWILWTLALAAAALVLFVLSALVDGPEPENALRPEQCRLLFAKYIAPGVVSTVFGEDAAYDPEDRLEDQQIPDHLFGWSAFDHYQGSQLIRASWRGRPVEACYAHLTRSHTVNGRKHINDIFKGHFLCTKTQIDPPAELRITEKYFGVLHMPVEEALPEDFNNVFNVTCEDTEAVREILSPQLRQQLVELRKHCSGGVYAVLQPGGHLIIAAGESGPDITEDSEVQKLREAYQKQLVFILELLDLFLTVE